MFFEHSNWLPAKRTNMKLEKKDPLEKVKHIYKPKDGTVDFCRWNPGYPGFHLPMKNMDPISGFHVVNDQHIPPGDKGHQWLDGKTKLNQGKLSGERVAYGKDGFKKSTPGSTHQLREGKVGYPVILQGFILYPRWLREFGS